VLIVDPVIYNDLDYMPYLHYSEDYLSMFSTVALQLHVSYFSHCQM